jgi:hypothetical protein
MTESGKKPPADDVPPKPTPTRVDRELFDSPAAGRAWDPEPQRIITGALFHRLATV